MSHEKEEIEVKGKSTLVDSVKVNNKILIITGKFPRIARLRDEEYDDVDDPQSMVAALKKLKSRPDIFTFWQRLPDTEPKYGYIMEWDNVAAIRINSFDDWFENQIKFKARNKIRKSGKKGVVIKQSEFNDEFIHGMVGIFNESPVRQNKPYWHYGKDFETIKKQFSKYIFREEVIGAYYDDDLIGFVMLCYAQKYALLGQIISKIEHRDKAPNNALIAKAVEVCADKKIPFLVYAKWADGSLGEFKRNNAFVKVDLPRYYIPLTLRGSIALKFNLHHGLTGILPEGIVSALKDLRRRWYQKALRPQKVSEAEGE